MSNCILHSCHHQTINFIIISQNILDFIIKMIGCLIFWMMGVVMETVAMVASSMFVMAVGIGNIHITRRTMMKSCRMLLLILLLLLSMLLVMLWYIIRI